MAWAQLDQLVALIAMSSRASGLWVVHRSCHTPDLLPMHSHAGLFVAAGHEGSGLCMGPATAHLILHHLDAYHQWAEPLEGANALGIGGSTVAELMPGVRLQA